MKKILVVSQKELVEKPIFRQDKNLNNIFDVLSEENVVDLLYLHKNIVVSDEKNNKDEKNEQKYMNIRKICIKDLMAKNMLQKNLKDLINKNGYEEIIFMSYSLAQFVMPYIEEELDNMVVVVDYRLSNLSYLLHQYKEEKQKVYHNFQTIYKQFRMIFLQSINIFGIGDYFIFDKEETDTYLIEKENVTNIISVEEINKELIKKEKYVMKSEVCEIEINSDNFSAKIPFNVCKKSEYSFVVGDSKYFNLIDMINEIICKSDVEYFFIHKNKLSILSGTTNTISNAIPHLLPLPRLSFGRACGSPAWVGDGVCY